MSNPLSNVKLNEILINWDYFENQQTIGAFIIQGTQIQQANQFFKEFLEITDNDIKNLDIYKIAEQCIHPDELKSFLDFINLENMKELGRTHEIKEYHIISKKSGNKWAGILLIPIIFNRKPSVFGILLNLTKQKNMEEEYNILSLASTIFNDMILLTDDFGRILYCKNVDHFFNEPESKILNSNIGEFVDSEDSPEFIYKINKLVTEGKLDPWETKILRRDHTHIPVEETAMVSQRISGKVTRAITIVRDITERKKFEEERLQTQRLDSIANLAGGLAHDFNNLLAGILGNIQLIQMDSELGEETKGYLKELEKATFRAKSLTHQLTTLAKGGNPIQKPESIKEIIENSVSLVMSGRKSICISNIQPNLPAVHVDANQISQILNNLLINADQAMPNGGKINISAEIASIQDITRYKLPHHNYIKVSVKDEGEGIAKENQAKIFTPYFTTKPNGTGLGLATSFSIIKRHMGYIGFTTKPKEFTTFFFFLPISEHKQEEIKENKKDTEIFSGSCLLLDDNEIFLKSLASTLQKMGFTADAVSNGNLAISFYIRHYKELGPYTFCIFDMVLPGSISGREVAQEILKFDPKAKILISSGSIDEKLFEQLKLEGILGFLQKPFSMEQIREQLLKIVKTDIYEYKKK